jgi:hypothetical protein
MIPSGRAKRQRSEVGQPVALVVRRNFIRLYGNLPSSKSQRVQNAASMAGISERSGWRLLDMYEGGGSDALVPETPGGANNTLLGNDEIRYLSLLWQSKPGAHVGGIPPPVHDGYERLRFRVCDLECPQQHAPADSQEENKKKCFESFFQRTK